MDKVDYSKIYMMKLSDTGLIPNLSGELNGFLKANKIHSIGRLIECMHNHSFTVRTYNDVMNQARGLIDIINCKYFGESLISSVYLDKPLMEIKFELPAGDFTTVGLRTDLKNKVSIYTVINRLGFSDEERNIILSLDVDRLLGKTLIDIFQDIMVERYYQKEINSEIDRVLYNKLLFYVNHTRGSIDESFELLNELSSLMNELGKLLKEKNNIDRQIENVKTKIDHIRSLKGKNK